MLKRSSEQWNVVVRAQWVRWSVRGALALQCGVGVGCDSLQADDSSVASSAAALTKEEPAPSAAGDEAGDAKDVACSRIRRFWAPECIDNQWTLVRVGYAEWTCSIEEGPFTDGEFTDCWTEQRDECGGGESCEDIPLSPHCEVGGPCGTVLDHLPPIDVPPGTVTPTRPPSESTDPAPGSVNP